MPGADGDRRHERRERRRCRLRSGRRLGGRLAGRNQSLRDVLTQKGAELLRVEQHAWVDDLSRRIGWATLEPHVG
jgi:hypothetical protein